MNKGSFQVASRDIAGAIRHYPLAGMLGWQDVRQRYRRSALGPFWLTISMGVMIGTIGVVFGSIFHSPMAEFLPFLATGLILWGFLSAVVTEGCMGFIGAEGIIKQLPIPLFVHILRMIWRNMIIFAHNIVILPIVFLAVGKPLSLKCPRLCFDYNQSRLGGVDTWHHLRPISGSSANSRQYSSNCFLPHSHCVDAKQHAASSRA